MPTSIDRHTCLCLWGSHLIMKQWNRQSSSQLTVLPEHNPNTCGMMSRVPWDRSMRCPMVSSKEKLSASKGDQEAPQSEKMSEHMIVDVI